MSRMESQCGSQIRFKTSMLMPSLCDYNDAYMLVNGTITIQAGPDYTTEANKKTDKRNQEVIFKDWAPYI